jgi:hypothetical protein
MLPSIQPKWLTRHLRFLKGSCEREYKLTKLMFDFVLLRIARRAG